MSATEELRRLLDERGVDYRVSATGYSLDIGPHMSVYANRSNTTLDVSMRNLTPQQAIEATLGRGTCRNMDEETDAEWFTCSECNTELRVHEPFDAFSIHYCPNCGRRVVDE